MGAAKPRLTDKRRVGGSRVRRQQLKGAGEHAAGAIVRGAGSIRLLGAVCRVLIPPPLPPAPPAVPHSLPSLSHNSLHCPASFADVMSCVAGAHARGGLQVNVTAPKGAEIMGNIVCSRPARVLVSFASDSPSRVDRRKLRQVSGRAFCCFAQCHAHTLTIAPTHARTHANTTRKRWSRRWRAWSSNRFLFLCLRLLAKRSRGHPCRHFRAASHRRASQRVSALASVMKAPWCCSR